VGHRNNVGRDGFGQWSKRRFLIFGGLVAVIGIVITLILFIRPERSTTNFCKVVKAEKPILVGDVNYEKRLEAYKKLETISPDDIRPDITAIRKGYEEIVKNPSNALGAGFGMAGSENRRDAFIKTNCKDF